MRAAVAPAYRIHLSPTSACHGHSCQWRPYSGTGDFEANAAMILIILLCALICALALNAAIRCFLRGQQRHRPVVDRRQQQPKSNAGVAAVALEGVPALVYSAATKTKLAGAEAECAICLSEFEEGQGIRLMARCNHGFHDHCIHQWLSSNSSCPTCRRTCLPPPPFKPHQTNDSCSPERE
ncbi:43kDa postsynaptic protein [Parasponia andersonii]|uniref:RING-type E3 ubiquitin transferase n=1 Tax=Parasponia andersonii TaxID=3476 RepID=A0A2P5AW08_PARAD|nr:43kDa postsynaptic protein [Parasponia andersonii]